MTSTTRSLTFREEGGGPRFTISTVHPLYNEGSGVVVQIVQAGEQFPMGELDRYEVEELHQFTYDLLAGPTPDPKLEAAADKCGWSWVDDGRRFQCCLDEPHYVHGSPDGVVRHVAGDGTICTQDPF